MITLTLSTGVRRDQANIFSATNNVQSRNRSDNQGVRTGRINGLTPSRFCDETVTNLFTRQNASAEVWQTHAFKVSLFEFILE